MKSFWDSLPRPIIGLSAMDGVTDAAMRHITKKYGNPDFMVTEFTSADGIVHGVTKLLRDFYYTDNQRPIIAQIFGANPEKFYTAAIICCALGFDGIDINMGCPADSAAKKGGGAALIKTPLLAQQIVRAVKQGVEDWTNGKTLESLSLPPEFANHIHARQQEKHIGQPNRQSLPVSVKTRIGYDKPVTETWVTQLLETEPAVITLHGRTLEQQYGGAADWEEIGKAVTIAHQTETLLFGNGDLTTPELIDQRIHETGVDGVWIGRAAMGNPWIFEEYRQWKANNGKDVHTPSVRERFNVALEHCELFEELNQTVFKDDPYPFLNMRKHLGWYVKGFPNAAELRSKLFQTNSSKEVKQILDLVES